MLSQASPLASKAFYPTMNLSLPPSLKFGLSSKLEKLEEIFEQFRASSLSVYDNYFSFIIVMGILNLLWEILTSPRTMNHQLSQRKPKGHLQGFIEKFISFSLVYLLFQIRTFSSSNLPHSKPNIAIQGFSQRVLEQQEVSLSSPPEELDLNLTSFVLSNDGNYVFALGRRL